MKNIPHHFRFFFTFHLFTELWFLSFTDLPKVSEIQNSSLCEKESELSEDLFLTEL